MTDNPEIFVKYIHGPSDTLSPIPLVIGPSLGTSVDTLWSRATPLLSKHFAIISWDLPGHGETRTTTQPFRIADLAEALADNLTELGVTEFFYAGVSIGGAVGLELTRIAADRMLGLGFLCSAARFGTPEAWKERAESVRSMGTPHLIIPTVSRWFSEGFLDRDPDISGRILNNLRDADNESYALAAEALATYDLRDSLPEIATPLLAISGNDDQVCTPEDMKFIAETVQNGEFLNIPGASHQVVAEKPQETVDALLKFFQKIETETR